MRIAVFNQFRYCQRTAQTSIPTVLDRGGKTKFPDTNPYSGNV